VATKLYPKAKKAFLDGEIDLLDNTIKAILVDSADYTYSDTHQYLSSVASGAIVATSGAFSSKTTTDGVFDAGDVTFSSVTGDQFEAVIIYKDTGDSATSNLIAYIDNATGLPITPSGGDITLQWDANGIFEI
jgi:phage tail sheath gpL-like